MVLCSVTSVLHFPVSVSCPTILTVSMVLGLGIPISTWCWKDRDELQWKRVPEIVLSLKMRHISSRERSVSKTPGSSRARKAVLASSP